MNNKLLNKNQLNQLIIKLALDTKTPKDDIIKCVKVGPVVTIKQIDLLIKNNHKSYNLN